MDEKSLKQMFKYFNRFMVFMWRLGLGPFINIWPEKIGRIMVLTHTGRRSGLTRRTPVNYAIVDDELYCTAAFGEATDWFRNIQAEPHVEVWLPQGWWAGEAQWVQEGETRLPVIRQILINSGFAASTFEGIQPRDLSEAELEKVARNYRLVHIRRTRGLTGPRCACRSGLGLAGDRAGAAGGLGLPPDFQEEKVKPLFTDRR